MANAQPLPAARAPATPIRTAALGLALAAVLGGAGFYAAWSGMIPGPAGAGAGAHGSPAAGGAEAPPLADIAFVAIDPVVVSLGPSATARHLKLSAQVEVASARSAEVQHLMPRILDVMNGYLRAIDVAEIEDPAALVRIRAQLLRRIQVVTGEGRVRDLLVTEFVLN